MILVGINEYITTKEWNRRGALGKETYKAFKGENNILRPADDRPF